MENLYGYSFTRLSVRLLAAMVFLTAPLAASRAQTSLEGWDAFKFGMTPSQVQKASNIPLVRSTDTKDSHKNRLFTSQVQVGFVKFNVDFWFKNINNVYKLNNIALKAPMDQACHLNYIIKELKEKYGRPTYSVWTTFKFTETVWHVGESGQVELDHYPPNPISCYFVIHYSDTRSYNGPPAAPSTRHAL